MAPRSAESLALLWGLQEKEDIWSWVSARAGADKWPKGSPGDGAVESECLRSSAASTPSSLPLPLPPPRSCLWTFPGNQEARKALGNLQLGKEGAGGPAYCAGCGMRWEVARGSREVSILTHSHVLMRNLGSELRRGARNGNLGKLLKTCSSYKNG